MHNHSTGQARLPLSPMPAGTKTDRQPHQLTPPEISKIAKSYLELAQWLDVAEYAREQRASDGESVDLVAALTTADKDRVPLLFRSTLGSNTGWFVGTLYLSRAAAVADGIVDAIHREIYTLDQSYWMNAEWNSWPLKTIYARLIAQGVHFKDLEQLKGPVKH